MRVCVVGNFGNNDTASDGQSIKTLELYNALRNYYGEKEVCRVNLHSKNRLLLLFKLLFRLAQSKNIIVLVSINGRKTVIPLLVYMNLLFHKKIYHSLIGSTTHKTLAENPKLISCYNRLAGNWSETSTEKKLLEKCGLNNVSVVKNFKHLPELTSADLTKNTDIPYKFCYFARIEELKGIENVVRAIIEVNKKYGETVCTLDIYGKVMNNYKKEFEKLKMIFDDNIRYLGVIDFDKSVDTLKKYYMLIFPTRYFTEGIPGTILDAFAAGLPIICSQWESCYDIMTDDVGIIYEFNNDDALQKAIEYSINHSEKISEMRENCLREAQRYKPNSVMKELENYLRG